MGCNRKGCDCGGSHGTHYPTPEPCYPPKTCCLTGPTGPPQDLSNIGFDVELRSQGGTGALLSGPFRVNNNARLVFATNSLQYKLSPNGGAIVEINAGPGETGPTGPTGWTGAQGVTGPMGGPGCDGPPGPPGPQGPIGPRGDPGPMGSQGCQGPRGDQGALGPQGVAGPQGSIGPRGDAGPQGPQGLQGPVGPMGCTGAQGNDGPTGPQGVTGPEGQQGIQGVTGPTGPALASTYGTINFTSQVVGPTQEITFGVYNPYGNLLWNLAPDSVNVTLVNTGTYEVLEIVDGAGPYLVNYGLSLQGIDNAYQARLRVNNSVVPNSGFQWGGETGAAFAASGSVVIFLCPGDQVLIEITKTEADPATVNQFIFSGYITVAKLNNGIMP